MNARFKGGTLALALGLALAMMGCTLLTGTTAIPFGPTAAPAIDRAAAANQLAALQAAQDTALDLWDRLIMGEDVSCAEAIALPPPLEGRAETSQAEQIQAEFASARSALEQSAARWDMECGYAGVTVGLDAARVGQESARQATDPLQAAQALLAAWTG